MSDWDSWLVTQEVPFEARELMSSGISQKKVPIMPFFKLGIKEADGEVYGSKVREEFWTSLGKHLQLPSTKPSSPSSGSIPGHKAAVSATALAAVTAVTSGPETQEVNDVDHVDHVDQTGGAETSMVDVDWGLLGGALSTQPTQSANLEPQTEPQRDVVSQALNSMGLNSSHSSPPSRAPEVPEIRKKKGMTHKVKSFLSGLPDLKHLYSKSVVT